MNLEEFHAICKSGQPKIVADWLEDLDDEYYTEIATQLRRQHGEWLLKRFTKLYLTPFLCDSCGKKDGYGYIFINLDSRKLPKDYHYGFRCYKCRDVAITGLSEISGLNIKCKAC